VISRVQPFFPLVFLCLVAASALATAASPAKNDDSAKSGAVLFRDKGCSYCHGPAGKGTKKAPPLTDLSKDKTWTTEKITNQILNGGQKMPPFRESVTDDEVTDLIAWLRAKNKPVPPPAESQDSAPADPPQ
jgi:mono/diheme cytochrome c family protein